MKRITFVLSILLILLASSCNPEGKESGEHRGIRFEIPAFQGSSAPSLSSLPAGFRVSLFSEEGGQLYLSPRTTVPSVSGLGFSFSYYSKDFGLKAGEHYYSFLPLASNSSYSAVTATYLGQSQSGNGDGSHLLSFIHSYAFAVPEDNGDGVEATFRYVPLTGILKLEIMLPAGTTCDVESVSLFGDTPDLFVTGLVVDLSPLASGGDPAIVKTTASSLSLSVDTTVSSGETLVVYFALGEGSLPEIEADHSFSVRVSTAEGTFESAPIASFEEIAAGQCRRMAVTVL